MATKILSHTFKVSKVPYTSSTDVIQSVRKRKERIIYSGQTSNENVNLAYVKSPEVTSDRNMFLSDHSFNIAKNIITNTASVNFTAASYNIETSSFLLTDTFTVATASLEATPLFYKHLISRTRYVPGTDTIVSMQVLDKDLQLVEKISQTLVSNTYHDGTQYGALFSNLENSFDSLTGLFEVYYVKYVIKTGSTLKTYVELLNNLPVYREAVVDDLDSNNSIKSNRKVYILEDIGSTFSVTMATSIPYSILQKGKTRIYLKKPLARTPADDWYLTLTNGQFITTAFNAANLVKYRIAEFSSQSFDPYDPYKSVIKAEPTHLSGSLYKVDHENLAIDDAQDFHVLVEIVQDGEVVSSYTTDVPNVGIRSVDQMGGFIDLFEKPKTNQTVLVSYKYAEKELELTEVNFNPALNINVANEMTVVYLVPESGSTRDQTVFYLRVDEAGKILFSSEAKLGDDIGVNIRGKGFGLDGLALDGITYTYSQFKQDFTVESTSLSTNASILILGEAYVGESIAPDQVTIIDIRKRGGGLLSTTPLNKNYESMWNWDVGFWDGTPYPGTASYFVEVPAELLTAHSGTLEKNEIRSIVEKHTAMGVYPIIKTYSSDPIITEAKINSTSVILTWLAGGAGVTYNVYRALSFEGPFTKLNGSPLVTNTYTDSTTSAKTHYWYMIVGIEQSKECKDSDGRYILEVQTR